MSSVPCPGCGQELSDATETCAKCGWSRYRPSAATLSMGPGVAVGVGAAPEVTFPLFPVANHKFILMTICSFGIYEVYWSYHNWKRISEASREMVSPLWRAIFCPLWGFSLFRRIDELAAAEGVATRWSPTLLATSYLILHMLWRAPDPWSWISMAAFLPMLPMQWTAQRINRQKLGVVTEEPNNRYSGQNIMLICIGGALFLLAFIDTFIVRVVE